MERKHLITLTKVDAIILTLILIVAFAFRMYKMTPVIGDFHSWRQADTAAVARNFVRNGLDVMHPKYDDLSNVQSGIENPNGYRFVEFPLYNALIAIMFKILPFVQLEIWGRLVSIFSSLIVIGIIYYFLRNEHSRAAAISGSLLYATFPFFVFFSRVILPESTALACVFLSLFFLYKYAHFENKFSWLTVLYITLSLILFACAVLIKPTAIFYALALAFLFFYKYSFSFLKKIDIYIFFILAGIPFILWRLYIRQYPEGIPVSDWLITSVNTYAGVQPIFFKPAFFRWIFFERINNIILGGYATFFFVLGLFHKYKRWFLPMILLSGLAYIFTFQGGNVQHEYYQTLILPCIAILVGLGTAFIIENEKLFISPIVAYPLIGFIYLFSFFISYTHVKDYYGYSNDLVQIATFVRSVTQPTDKIVTDTTGDTTLLYMIDRKGAPSVFKSLPELKEKGYTYFVTLNKDVAKDVEKQFGYKIIGQNDKFTLFQL